MRSTMQDHDLSLATLMEHATTFHSQATVSTWTGSGLCSITFGELGVQAARLANALRALGIADGDRVATFMWNDNEHMIAYTAIPAMGAVLHPLNIRLTSEQLCFIVNEAGDKVIIVGAGLIERLARCLESLRTVEHVIVVAGTDELVLPDLPGITLHRWSELTDVQPDTFDWPELDERQAAAACYTSGTTGDPKGVVYSHRSIWLHSTHVMSTAGMALSEADHALAIVPMFHAMSWGLPHTALMCGASLLLPGRFLQPQPIAEMLAAGRPTFAAAVPTVWTGLLTHLHDHPQDLSHLRGVVVGGSAVSPALMHAFQDGFGVEVLQVWGMTETSPLVTVARAPATASGSDRWQYRYMQGRLPAGVTARLVDEHGVVLPADGRSVGELQVRGPWITGRYHRDDGDDHPVDENFDDGWLRTGDVGTISAKGYLALVDRRKDIIKSGGEWISSIDLENTVAAHPSVLEAAVIGVPDPRWEERPLVAVVLADGASVTVEELRDHLAGGFAKWQLPDLWTFLDRIPRTSIGKFDKKTLRSMHSAGSLRLLRS